MHATSIRPNSFVRSVVASLVLVGLVAATGCSWLRKENKLYAQNQDSRPLEVPPDLDLPRTAGAIAPSASAPAVAVASPAPAAAPAAATAVAAAPAVANGFNVAGSRDEVFAKVGTALAAIDGVQVASSAALLGVFDVNYQGSNFLVRVTTAEAGANVAAVDPRGMPASGDAPAGLIAALKGAIGGN